MKQFSSRQGLDILEMSDPVRCLVEHLLAVELSISKSENLDPDDAQLYLVEAADNEQSIVQAVGAPIRSGLFEGVKYHSSSRSFVCQFLPNNQCCITLIIPDREWLREDWRSILDKEVTP